MKRSSSTRWRCWAKAKACATFPPTCRLRRSRKRSSRGTPTIPARPTTGFMRWTTRSTPRERSWPRARCRRSRPVRRTRNICARIFFWHWECGMTWCEANIAATTRDEPAGRRCRKAAQTLRPLHITGSNTATSNRVASAQQRAWLPAAARKRCNPEWRPRRAVPSILTMRVSPLSSRCAPAISSTPVAGRMKWPDGRWTWARRSCRKSTMHSPQGLPPLNAAICPPPETLSPRCSSFCRRLRLSSIAAGTPPADPMRRVPQIQKLQLQAVILSAEGHGDEAIAMAQQAVATGEELPYAFGPPSPEKPSYELLGELLLKENRNAPARAAFEASLQRAPQRTESLLGLARAESAMGDKAAAAET